MANISIDNFIIKSYEHGWMLQERVTRIRQSDDPQGRWSAGESYDDINTLCYPGSLSKALQSLVEHKLRRSDAANLQEVREVAEELRRVFEVAVI